MAYCVILFKRNHDHLLLYLNVYLCLTLLIAIDMVNIQVPLGYAVSDHKPSNWSFIWLPSPRIALHHLLLLILCFAGVWCSQVLWEDLQAADLSPDPSLQVEPTERAQEEVSSLVRVLRLSVCPLLGYTSTVTSGLRKLCADRLKYKQVEGNKISLMSA